MLIGVHDVHYGVDDIARAIDFYRDVLGMKVCERAPLWCSLEFFGARVGLLARPSPALPNAGIWQFGAFGASFGATLTLRSTDIDADLDYLNRCGVRIVNREVHSWGRIAEILDSEGNCLKLMQTPTRMD